jgi:hypothetical protein
MADSLDLEVDTSTGTSTAAPIVRDKDGRNVLVVILKYTYRADRFDRMVAMEDEPAEVDFVDTYHGDDPAKSSIRRPSQLFDQKPGTDVVLLGHAHPPRGSASATHVDVSLRVGRLAKVVRAYGLRVWQTGTAGGLKPGPARPIREPVPLIYELAWGGLDVSDETKPVGEARNYIGRGVARDPKELIHTPAAQLEDPAHPIDGRNNVPSAYNPIHRHWMPRRQYAGTYDQAWMDTRMPILPEDFDVRYHVCVAPDQWSEIPLRGDEAMEVTGATPEGLWRFQLPRVAPGFASVQGGQRSEHRTHLDTILIDADEKRVELTWRTAIRMPRKYELLERVLVFEKNVV